MKRIAFAATLLLASAPALLACSACFGKSDSAMARSLNASIFTLMGVAGVVLAGAASFFVFLAKRAAAFAKSEQATQPPSQPNA
jgi:hypothetical protein